MTQTTVSARQARIVHDHFKSVAKLRFDQIYSRLIFKLVFLYGPRKMKFVVLMSLGGKKVLHLCVRKTIQTDNRGQVTTTRVHPPMHTHPTQPLASLAGVHSTPYRSHGLDRPVKLVYTIDMGYSWAGLFLFNRLHHKMLRRSVFGGPKSKFTCYTLRLCL